MPRRKTKTPTPPDVALPTDSPAQAAQRRARQAQHLRNQAGGAQLVVDALTTSGHTDAAREASIVVATILRDELGDPTAKPLTNDPAHLRQGAARAYEALVAAKVGNPAIGTALSILAHLKHPSVPALAKAHGLTE